MLIYKYHKIALFYIIYVINSMENTKYREKIVGGIADEISNCPYVVSIHKLKHHFCGGAIIHPSMILSAAHCFFDYETDLIVDTSWYDIYAGTSDSEDLTSAQMSNINTIIIHPEWDTIEHTNDISIIILISNFMYNTFVQPLSLAKPDMFRNKEPSQYFSRNSCIVSGWGYIQEDDVKTSKQLRSAALSLIDNVSCKKLWSVYLTDEQICTLVLNKDACKGDSGSPLVCEGVGVGIVSWGIGCARNNSPGVWTRIDKYYDWIKIITYNNNKGKYARLWSGGQRSKTKGFIYISVIFYRIIIIIYLKK